VPGFYGGAEIWIMEENGTHLRRVRSSDGGHLDHPTLTPDLEHVIYSEFDDPAKYVAGKAWLWKEHLYTGERTVLRSLDGCSIHHNTISPIDGALSYMVSRPGAHEQVTEVDGQPVTIRAPAADRRRLLANGVSIPGGLVLQGEDLPRAASRHISIEIYRHRGNTLTPVTVTAARHRRPAISPSGTWLVWQSNERDTEVDDLHLAGLDGSQHRLLTSSRANDGHPWFSRDGEWVFFESDRTGGWEIHKLHLESGTIVQVTDDPAYVNTRPRC
jgi:hypothetical protein